MKTIEAKQLAICDGDTEYLELIQAYLKKKNPMGFEILTFNNTKEALEESAKDKFEILLVGEKTYDKNVKKINAGKIFILQEDGLSGIQGYEMVAKYQSMEKLIGHVLEEYALDDAKAMNIRCGKNNTSLISFYSPEHHGAQSLAALAAAEILADKGNKVLYINLQGFSGFEELMNITYESDITDFMYFVLEHSEKLLYKLEGMKRNVHGVDYLPPALDYKDIMQISDAEWQQALDLIIYSGDYTHIVVDLSETCQGFYGILEKSEKAYVLYNANSMYGQSALSHFKRLLGAKEFNGILNKIIEVSLPYELSQGRLQLESLSAHAVGGFLGGII